MRNILLDYDVILRDQLNSLANCFLILTISLVESLSIIKSLTINP